MTDLENRILITGGSGFIGRALVSHLTTAGYQCLVPSRHPSRTQSQLPRPAKALSYGDPWPEVHAVINLAGESIIGLWTPAKKARILHSRINVTRQLITWMKIIDHRPAVFLSMSAVGIYGNRPGERLHEESPLDPERKFRYQVCRVWEDAALPAKESGVRVVLLRMGNVLHPAGSYLGNLLALYRHLPVVGLGRPGTMFSWISRRDAVRCLHFILEQESLSGVLNVTAPFPVQQGAFTRLLAGRLGKPVRGHLPNPLFRLGLGDFADAFVDSQAVYPAKILGAGFTFRDADMVQALNNWFAS